MNTPMETLFNWGFDKTTYSKDPSSEFWIDKATHRVLQMKESLDNFFKVKLDDTL